ncbi:hypothetical protein HK101_006972, partial [Irineochytrium annulatum]
MVLTKGMFVDVRHLFSYTCLLPPLVHAYVDAHMNCEDVAMNMMVSGVTGVGPRAMYVEGRNGIEDFGTAKGISKMDGHKQRRSLCLADLAVAFGGMTLVEERLMSGAFRRPSRFVKVEVEEL